MVIVIMQLHTIAAMTMTSNTKDVITMMEMTLMMSKMRMVIMVKLTVMQLIATTKPSRLTTKTEKSKQIITAAMPKLTP